MLSRACPLLTLTDLAMLIAGGEVHQGSRSQGSARSRNLRQISTGGSQDPWRLQEPAARNQPLMKHLQLHSFK